MIVLPTTNRDVLTLRSTAGCLGVMAIVVGFILVVCVQVPAPMRGGEDIPWYIGLPIGVCGLIGGIGIRGVRTIFRFGNHLSETEKTYVSQVIQSALER